MTSQTEITQRNHHRAVRFFWCLLIGATMVSLVGNVAHAMVPYVPRIVVQIGAAAVPPIALLAAVHGIALAVRAGASGTIYRWAVGAVVVIGVGAFSVSFVALRDLMQAIGYSPATAWLLPAIVDTTVGVSMTMLVALGDNPARRARTVAAQVKPSAPTAPAPVSAPSRPRSVRADQVTSSAESAPVNPALLAASATYQHADHAALAQALVDAGATTKPVALVASILTAHAEGTALNRIASDTGIHHKTVSKIIAAAEGQQKGRLVAV